MRNWIESYLVNCNPKKEIPTIILSWAQSLDGCLSLTQGMPSAISSPESLVLTHTIRSLAQGILVGINTIISDDPILTCRLEGDATIPNSPIPIILDSKLRIPLTSRILERSPIICTTKDADLAAKDFLQKRGTHVEVIDQNSSGSVHLPSLLPILKSQYGIDILMVEGGAQVLQGFLFDKLAHVIIMTIAPKFFGNGVSLGGKYLPFSVDSATFKSVGSDIVLIGYPLFN